MSFKDDARRLVGASVSEAATFLAEKQATDWGQTAATAGIGALAGGGLGGLYSMLADDKEDENYSPMSRILGGAAIGGLGGAGFNYLSQQPSENPNGDKPVPKTREDFAAENVTSPTGSALSAVGMPSTGAASILDPALAAGAGYGLASIPGTKVHQLLSQPKDPRAAIQSWMAADKKTPSMDVMTKELGMSPAEAQAVADYAGGKPGTMAPHKPSLLERFRPGASAGDLVMATGKGPVGFGGEQSNAVAVPRGKMQGVIDVATRRPGWGRTGKAVSGLLAGATAYGSQRMQDNALKALYDAQQATAAK